MRSLVFVGCNIGEDVTEAVMAHDVVWLFEPIPEIARELAKQFYSEDFCDKCIRVINAACWTEPGPRRFNLYNETNGLSSSLGTINPQAQQYWPQYDLGLIDSVTVDCVRLNEYMPGWLDDLIIDAQGADLEILKTIQPWLVEGRVGTIRIECDGPDFQHYDLADNSEASLLEYMAPFPYRGERDETTVRHNPDYVFQRI